MKIVWLCPYPLSFIKKIPIHYSKRQYHPSTWIVTLSNALSKKGDVELHIVTEYTNISKSFYIYKDKIYFHLLRSGSAVPFTYKGYPSYFPLDVIFSFKKNRKSLLNELRIIKPDIVHAHGTEQAYAIAAVESKLPHIISIQGIISKLSKVNPNYRYRKIASIEKFVIKNGKNFIAKTNFANRFIHSLNPESNIYLIENIVHPAFFKIIRNDYLNNYIVYVGNINANKGVDELIKAFSKFVALQNDYKLLIIGNGDREYIHQCRKIANKFKISSKVEWFGHQTHEQIASVFESAKVLVHPSKMDTSPNTVSEAMVAGLPCIATKVGGIPDMISHKKNGYLIDNVNGDDIYNALKDLIFNQRLYNSISNNSRIIGRRRFSEEKNVDKVINVYKKVIQTRFREDI